MKKKDNKKKEKILKITLVFALVAGMLLATFSIPIVPDTHESGEIKMRTWQSFSALAENTSMGAAGGGILHLIIMAHDAGETYATNASVATNLTNCTWDNFDLDIPHSTSFDIVIRARFNTTQAYSASNSTWVLAWTRCRITATDYPLEIAADTVMEKTEIVNCTDFIWVHFYLKQNASAQDLKLLRDSSISVSSIKLEAYY